MLDEEPAIPKPRLRFVDLLPGDPKIKSEERLWPPSDALLVDMIEKREENKRLSLGEPKVTDAPTKKPACCDSCHTSHTSLEVTQPLINCHMAPQLTLRPPHGRRRFQKPHSHATGFSVIQRPDNDAVYVYGRTSGLTNNSDVQGAHSATPCSRVTSEMRPSDRSIIISSSS